MVTLLYVLLLAGYKHMIIHYMLSRKKGSIEYCYYGGFFFPLPRRGEYDEPILSDSLAFFFFLGHSGNRSLALELECEILHTWRHLSLPFWKGFAKDRMEARNRPQTDLQEATESCCPTKG